MAEDTFLCSELDYPSFSYGQPHVEWIAYDDCQVADAFVEEIIGSSEGFADAAKTRALNFINSVDDGRIIITPDPIPIWPPL